MSGATAKELILNEAPVTHRGVVFPAQCDAMGHMNTPFYVAAFDQAMWHLVSGLGYRSSWIEERGEGWADVKYVLEFRSELRAGQLYHVSSSVSRIGKSSLVSRHRLIRTEDDVLAAEVEITSVYFDLKQRVSRPIPAVIRTSAELLIDRQSQNPK